MGGVRAVGRLGTSIARSLIRGGEDLARSSRMRDMRASTCEELLPGVRLGFGGASGGVAVQGAKHCGWSMLLL